MANRLGSAHHGGWTLVVENAVGAVKPLGCHDVFIIKALFEIARFGLLKLHMPLWRKLAKFSVTGHSLTVDYGVGIRSHCETPGTGAGDFLPLYGFQTELAIVDLRVMVSKYDLTCF